MEYTHTTAKYLSDWDELILKGSPVGAIPRIPPTFQPTINLPEEAFIGIFDVFRELVEIIKSSRGYTPAIGKDLMITGEIQEPDFNRIFPILKIQTFSGYRVRIESSLQGMNAMRIEYLHKNVQNWQPVAFLTKFPAEIKITPRLNGEPETGQLRAILIRNNDMIGQFSLNYPISIS